MAEAYLILGIERNLEVSEDEHSFGPIFPNGDSIESHLPYVLDEPLDPDALELVASYQFNGGDFLIGYVLAYLEHRAGFEVDGRADDPLVRQKLLTDLSEVGFEVEDADIKTYLHLNSDQWDYAL